MDQLDQIRSKTDIVQLISSYISLKKAGRNFKANCPFHAEKTPSFIISPERQIWKCFGCFPKGQLIKTKKGLIPIESIIQGIEVFTHKGRWQKVIRLLEREYDGDLISIKTKKLTEIVSLTGDHKIYVIKTKTCKYKDRKTRICQSRCDRFCPAQYYKDYKLEKIEARRLSKNDYLLYPVNKEINDIKQINLKKYLYRANPKHGSFPRNIRYKIPVNKDFLKLVGYWIAEGSNHRAYIRFNLGNHERSFAEAIKNIIKRVFNLETGIHYRLKNKSGIEVTICHSFLADIFANLCGKGAINKHIPYDFINLPPEKLKVLVDAILKGDGHIDLKRQKKSTPGGKSIATISPILIFQLKEILLKLGLEPGLYYKNEFKDKKGINHRKNYTIYWKERPVAHHTSFLTNKNGIKYWLLPIKEIIKKKFKGKVYNFTVENDHSYVANNFVVANCGAGGDVFKFLTEYEKIGFGEAVRILAEKAGITLESYQPSTVQKERDKFLSINHLASEFYHYVLMNHPVGKKGLDYLLKRGVGPNAIKLFKLGYAPNNWQLLQDFLCRKKGYKASDLEKIGLIIRSQHGNYYDRFRGRIIFPLTDQRGNILGFSARSLKSDAKEAKYINSPETTLYHKSELLFGLKQSKEYLKKKNQVVVVEGEFDMISSFLAEVKNVVAIKGSALTEGQVNLIKRFCSTVILSLDADLAGDAAIHRGIEIADKAGLNIRITEPKYGKDPDECARHSPKLWRESIDKALPVFDFYLDSAVKRFDKNSPEGKKQISDELLPLFWKITNEIVKSHYLKKIADLLSVDEESVLREMERLSRRKKIDFKFKPDLAIKIKLSSRTRKEMLEEFFLSLILQTEDRVSELVGDLEEELFSQPAVKKIIQSLRKYVVNHKFKINEFVKILPEELVETVDRLYLQDLQTILKDEGLFSRELAKTKKELAKLQLKDKITNLVSEIRNKEKMDDQSSLLALREKFTVLTLRLKELS